MQSFIQSCGTPIFLIKNLIGLGVRYQATTKERSHMTLKKSLDDGASWQVETLIYAGPAAYSLVVPLTNSSLGVVYERNGPGKIA